MLIKANGNGQRTMPPEGNWVGVVDAVYDLGLQRPFQEGDQPRNRYALLIHIGKNIESGPLAGQSHKASMILTGSTYRKSKMGKVMMALMPRLTEEVLESGKVDLEDLLGRNGLFNIRHVQRNGNLTYEIDNVSPLPAGMPNLVRIPETKPPDWVLRFQEQRLDKPVPVSAQPVPAEDDEEPADLGPLFE